MLHKENMRNVILKQKEAKNLTWDDIAAAINRSPVYAAMLCYGYGQADDQEADALAQLLELSPEVRNDLTKAPDRRPAGPWPPTDPFIYRLYEVVMLYGPVLKDVCHEMFGDGIMSAIDMSLDVQKVQGETGDERVVLSLNGKWLRYKKF